MKFTQLFKQLHDAAAMLSAVDAAVATVINTTIDAGIRGTQQGRLSRNNVYQQWDGSEPFPGVINPTVTYYYSTFAVYVGSLNYVDISIDSLSPNTFVSAYQTNYVPTSLSTNWLGDDGGSGNFFSGSDASFFDVVAAVNSTLIIVVANTAAGGVGISDPFTIVVTGYSDTAYSNFADLDITRVPEPSTLLLLLAPLGLVAGRKLRARRNHTTGALALA